MKRIKYHTINIAVPEKLDISVYANEEEIYSIETKILRICPEGSLRDIESMVENIYRQRDKYYNENKTEAEVLKMKMEDYKNLIWYISNQRGHIEVLDNFAGMKIVIKKDGKPELVGSSSQEMFKEFRKNE